jgi:hypothetical protein
VVADGSLPLISKFIEDYMDLGIRAKDSGKGCAIALAEAGGEINREFYQIRPLYEISNANT